MADIPKRKITIYHKNNNTFERYVIEASYRNTSIQNRNKNGTSSSDNALIRIFDLEEYNSKWFVEKGDIVVNREVDDDIKETPATILSKKYGVQNVHKVVSIGDFNFNDEDIEELKHIKIGAI